MKIDPVAIADAVVSAKVAAITGSGTAMIQAASGGNGILSQLLVPAISAVVGWALSFVVLQTTVSRQKTDIAELRAKVDQAATDIAFIRGLMERGK
jgi:hypothetical protein